MGKKGLSDKVRRKQKNKAKQQPNPFEVKVNKVKHTVVNRKLQKWEKGVPGVSRSKSVKKRQDTLLKELHHMKKANLLLDKRFGENDATLTADEKMIQRFAIEKKKKLRKSDFSLNEDEDVLSHYGQSLAENLQDTIGSDSEVDDAGGSMRTGDLQFGGFSKEGEVSWQDKMKAVIADSKKQKYERQVEKEKTLETTSELDNNWRSLAPSLNALKKKEIGAKKPSSYMQLFHSLVLEQKSSGATDKLKTEEEMAKEEAERLKKLETERLDRMKGSSKKQEKSHISADDLNDGFAFDKSSQKITFAVPENSEGESDKDDSNQEEVKGGNDKGVEGEDNSDEEEETEGDDKNDDDDDDDDSEEDESASEASDGFSDLASSGESESEGEEDEKPKKEMTAKPKPKSILKKNKKIDNHCEKVIESSLPFVYAAPGSYEELETLLHGHSAKEQATIVSRLRKCHHPSLAEGNREKLEKIQEYLLLYYGEVVKQQPLDKLLVDHVTVNLWEMTQTSPVVSATFLQALVVERQREYAVVAQRKGGRGTFIDMDTLMYLTLIETLFPSSDFRHPVTTPAIHFISQMLAECPVRTAKDVVIGLFLCALALKYVNLSKRYIPEVVTFLHGLLFLAVEKNTGQETQVFPPFRAQGKACNLLKVQNKCLAATDKWCLTELLNQEPAQQDNDQFRCSAVDQSLSLVIDCVKLWENLPCLSSVVKPLKQLLPLLPASLYSADTRGKIEIVTKQIEASEHKKQKVMQQPAKKPVPLKLFEPEIQEFWSGKRKKGGPNKDVNERQRLTHKYKHEMKAAIREIKRDNEVLAKHQLETVMKKDAERKRKTKELFQSLASQEGDYKKIKKMKQ